MIHIKIHKKTPVFVTIIVSLFMIALAGFFIYIIFSDSDTSSRTTRSLSDFIWLVVFFIPVLFASSTSKEMYASDMYISENDISVIYKIKNNVVKTEIINKDEIISSIANIDANIRTAGKGSYTVCMTDFQIKTNSGKILRVFEDSSSQLSGCPYHFILDLIKYGREIPNFSYNLTGNSSVAIEDIKFFAIYGKKLPFFKKIYIGVKNTSGKVGLVILGIIFSIWLAIILFLLWMSIPMGKLSDTEKQYMVHYNKAVELRIEQNDYYAAIDEQNKAEAIISNTSETYLEKAYSYKKLKQYDKAIKEAEEGLKYVNNKSVYRKYHNFKFVGKKDIELYTVLGQCYEKVKEYKKMIECYDYVINHTHYTYQDAYFPRGRAKYYMNDFSGALEDFYKHKAIIEKYFADQEAETEYKDLYPRYDIDDLIKIQKWINAAKTYL